MPYDENEQLRAQFRPERVRVIFAGESPPVGGTFFYAANSHLHRYTREAFAMVYPNRWSSAQEFLEFFKSLGCFLDDLCLDPVNHLTPPERRKKLIESIPSFAERIRAVQPVVVVCLMTAIRQYVAKAVEMAGLTEMPMYVLPYPTHGNQHKYMARLQEVLQELRRDEILP